MLWKWTTQEKNHELWNFTYEQFIRLDLLATVAYSIVNVRFNNLAFRGRCGYRNLEHMYLVIIISLFIASGIPVSQGPRGLSALCV